MTNQTEITLKLKRGQKIYLIDTSDREFALDEKGFEAWKKNAIYTNNLEDIEVYEMVIQKCYSPELGLVEVKNGDAHE